MTFSKDISARCNNEVTLPLQEELLFTKLLMDRATDAVFWVAKDAHFLYVNDAACDMVGYSREELLMMTMQDVDAEFSSKIWLEYWKTIKENGSIYFESIHQSKVALSFPVEITVTYLEYYGREYGCIFVRNITKRRQAEIALVRANEELECRVERRTAELRNTNEQLCCEIVERWRVERELRSSEEQLRATFNSAAVGIAHVSRDGGWLMVNQKLCNIIGYTQLPLRSLTFDDIIHPDDQNSDREYIRQLLALEIQTYSIEKRLIHKNGSPVWTNLTISLVCEPNSEPKYFICIVEDISERKQAESALRDSEALFRTLAETTNAIVFILQNARVCYVNPVVEAITGYKREELLTHSHLYQKLNLKEPDLLDEQCSSELVQHQELKILTKSGEDRWLDWSEGVFQFEGKPAKLVTAIDITARIQAEVKVRQALEQEKELGELKSRFVCMVSHEFRNPLHLISFSTSALKRQINQSIEDKKLNYLNRIQTAVEHLTNLMDDVLILGISDARKIIFEPRAVNLEQFCGDLVTQLQLSYATDYTIVFTSLGQCYTACVDEKLLQPILTNLLDNAIKYSPKGSIVNLTLSFQEEEVIFQIQDRGIGISPIDIHQVFEPFYRGNNVGDIEGTGLGLAVVKNLVELHLGKISLAAEVDIGSTFTIRIPLRESLPAQKYTPAIITTQTFNHQAKLA